MTVKCPHCKKEHVVSLTAMIPPEQRITMTMKTENQHFEASVISESLDSLARVLKGVARSMGCEVCVFAERVSIDRQGCVMTLLVVDSPKVTKQKKANEYLP